LQQEFSGKHAHFWAHCVHTECTRFSGNQDHQSERKAAIALINSAGGSQNYLSMLPEDHQLSRKQNPKLEGLKPANEVLAIGPTGVRPYLADTAALDAMKDHSGFIREAIRGVLP
jgi:hypothetical protein